MNYQKVYGQIVDRARVDSRAKGSSIYYESHHIVPKCISGSDDSNNKVLLTAREHFICH